MNNHNDIVSFNGQKNVNNYNITVTVIWNQRYVAQIRFEKLTLKSAAAIVTMTTLILRNFLK